MEPITRPLVEADVHSASQLDRKLFKEYGISESQLAEYIAQHPTKSLALIADNKFSGFATFEVLSQDSNPRDYVGKIPNASRVLFIQQFTTTTNYSVVDMSMDKKLIETVESKAKDLGCDEVWEALATTHPYSKAVNPEYDAFGFYNKNNYTFDPSSLIEWRPDDTVSIPCYLFRKELK